MKKLMSFFKEEKVESMLLQQTLVYMQEALRPCPSLPMFPEVPHPTVEHEDMVERLASLGFNKSKLNREANTMRKMEREKQFEEDKRLFMIKKTHEDNVSAFKLLARYRKEIYRDTLLVTYKDFDSIMRRYDLVCGTFDKYLGDVPFDKIGEIERVVELADNRKLIGVNPVFPILEYRDSEYKLPKHLARFPFAMAICWDGIDVYGQIMSRNKFTFGSGIYLFICAPAKEMEAVNYNRIIIRSTTDPFICAHTNYGILVFSRWGEEANDDVVKKYERLCELMDKYL